MMVAYFFMGEVQNKNFGLIFNLYFLYLCKDTYDKYVHPHTHTHNTYKCVYVLCVCVLMNLRFPAYLLHHIPLCFFMFQAEMQW